MTDATAATRGASAKTAADATAQQTPTSATVSPREALMADLIKKTQQTRLEEDARALAEGVTLEELALGSATPESIAAEEAAATPPAVAKGAPTGDPAIDGEDESAPAAAAPAKPLEPLAKPLTVVEKDGVKYVHLKVNGRDTVVPLDKALSKAQKSWAAEQQLEEASTRLHDLDLRERAIAQREQQARPPAAATPPSPPVPPAKLDKFIKAVYDGDPEEARNVLGEIFQERTLTAAPPASANPWDPRQVQQVIHQTVDEALHQRDLGDAVEQFRVDHPDIASDPRLWKIADELSGQIARSNPDLPPADILVEAAKQTRDWMKSFSGAAPATSLPPASPTQDRKVLKRQVAAPIIGQHLPANLGNDPPPPRTSAQVITDMKRARGQAV